MSDDAPSGTPPSPRPRPSLFRRYGWIGVLAIPVLGSVLGVCTYGVATDWYFLRPGVPTFDRFLKDPSKVNALAREIGVPGPPPDVGEDPQRAWAFHEAYGRLRQAPRDVSAVGALGRLFEEGGEIEKAVTCYRRAVEWDPDNPRWHYHLARVWDRLGQTERAGEARDRGDALARAAGLAPMDPQTLLEELRVREPR